MGRKAITIPFNPTILKSELLQRNWTIEMVGTFFGVSRQAANAWFQAERIPPRRMADLAQKLELEPKTVERILDWKDSVKDLARENIKLREENEKLKQAIEALLGEK